MAQKKKTEKSFYFIMNNGIIRPFLFPKKTVIPTELQFFKAH